MGDWTKYYVNMGSIREVECFWEAAFEAIKDPASRFFDAHIWFLSECHKHASIPKLPYKERG